VLLNLTARISAPGGLNPNQQGAANTINNFFNNGGTLPTNFLPAFGANSGSALSQLDGEAATGAEHGAFHLMNEFLIPFPHQRELTIYGKEVMERTSLGLRLM
jgi:hypothetical protein